MVANQSGCSVQDCLAHIAPVGFDRLTPQPGHYNTIREGANATSRFIIDTLYRILRPAPQTDRKEPT